MCLCLDLFFRDQLVDVKLLRKEVHVEVVDLLLEVVVVAAGLVELVFEVVLLEVVLLEVVLLEVIHQVKTPSRSRQRYGSLDICIIFGNIFHKWTVFIGKRRVWS